MGLDDLRGGDVDKVFFRRLDIVNDNRINLLLDFWQWRIDRNDALDAVILRNENISAVL